MIRQQRMYLVICAGREGHLRAVRAAWSYWSTIQEAQAQALRDQEKHQEQEQIFSWQVVRGEIWTLETWPQLVLAVHQAPDQTERYHATARLDDWRVVTCRGDSIEALLVSLLGHSIHAVKLLGSPEAYAAQIGSVPLYLLDLLKHRAVVIDAQLDSAVRAWVSSAASLQYQYTALMAWWQQTCDRPVFLETVPARQPKWLIGAEGWALGCVLASDDETGDREYVNSVWPSVVRATQAGVSWMERDSRIVSFQPERTELFHHVTHPDLVVALYRTCAGEFQAAVFTVANDETAATGPEWQRLNEFQMPHIMSASTAELAWLRLVTVMFDQTISGFWKFTTPYLALLPLAVLNRVGYEAPASMRRRLARWVEAVEKSQRLYQQALAAMGQELPR